MPSRGAGGAHYDKACADLANGRTATFFRQHLELTRAGSTRLPRSTSDQPERTMNRVPAIAAALACLSFPLAALAEPPKAMIESGTTGRHERRRDRYLQGHSLRRAAHRSAALGAAGRSGSLDAALAMHRLSVRSVRNRRGPTVPRRLAAQRHRAKTVSA